MTPDQRFWSRTCRSPRFEKAGLDALWEAVIVVLSLYESDYYDLGVCVCLSMSVFVCVCVCMSERELVSGLSQILRYDLKFANA